ncbi:hypothetical protein DFJ58DRAFT_842654 [Suillus subalutaceus]|uniref:uncharacterized protein n=1 Tax=Suillus subalutaceus TaxID=48586 RepID=UPI001B87B234|nr:uncharacterized protein DFJ58DRAFT_842654 [Suillus subalutaceus]KAG1849447.1 hypothetical protein DFJ58DRAFT_842654 [Suillus subalutaceus]
MDTSSVEVEGCGNTDERLSHGSLQGQRFSLKVTTEYTQCLFVDLTLILDSIFLAVSLFFVNLTLILDDVFLVASLFFVPLIIDGVFLAPVFFRLNSYSGWRLYYDDISVMMT